VPLRQVNTAAIWSSRRTLELARQQKALSQCCSAKLLQIAIVGHSFLLAQLVDVLGLQLKLLAVGESLAFMANELSQVNGQVTVNVFFMPSRSTVNAMSEPATKGPCP